MIEREKNLSCCYFCQSYGALFTPLTKPNCRALTFNGQVENCKPYRPWFADSNDAKEENVYIFYHDKVHDLSL